MSDSDEEAHLRGGYHNDDRRQLKMMESGDTKYYNRSTRSRSRSPENNYVKDQRRSYRYPYEKNRKYTDRDREGRAMTYKRDGWGNRGRYNDMRNQNDRRGYDNSEEKESECTLTLYHIPKKLCTPYELMKHFKTFGTVFRIKCISKKAIAHIMFLHPHEAQAAYESPQPVFFNPEINVTIAKHDIPPLNEAVKEQYVHNVPFFFYDLHDKSTHFSSNSFANKSDGNHITAQKEKYTWTNVDYSAPSTTPNNLMLSNNIDAEKVGDDTSSLNAQAEQLKKVIAQRKKALALLEERKRLEEKLKEKEKRILEEEEKQKSALHDGVSKVSEKVASAIVGAAVGSVFPVEDDDLEDIEDNLLQ